MDGVTSETVRHFGGISSAPQLASLRQWVRGELAGIIDDTVQDTELVATELVSNAYEHAAGPTAVRLSHSPDGIRIEVDDTCPDLLPFARRGTPTSNRGRGLLMIERIHGEWGVTREPDRKTVWATIPFAF